MTATARPGPASARAQPALARGSVPARLSTPARRSGPARRWAQARRWGRARPELPLWAVVGGAWAAVAVVHLRPGEGPAHHDSEPTAAGVALALGAWLLMVVAMVLPFALPEARWLARRSLPSRRGRVLAAFAVGLVAPWAAAGAVLVPAAAVLDPAAHRATAVGLLVGAAAWHRARPRLAALRRCGSLPVPAIRGWRADASCAHAGLVRGRRCLTTCLPAMAAMAVAPGLALMAALTALQWSEQGRGPDPHRRGARRSHAAALVVLAGLVALVG